MQSASSVVASCLFTCCGYKKEDVLDKSKIQQSFLHSELFSDVYLNKHQLNSFLPSHHKTTNTDYQVFIWNIKRQKILLFFFCCWLCVLILKSGLTSFIKFNYTFSVWLIISFFFFLIEKNNIDFKTFTSLLSIFWIVTLRKNVLFYLKFYQSNCQNFRVV